MGPDHGPDSGPPEDDRHHDNSSGNQDRPPGEFDAVLAALHRLFLGDTSMPAVLQRVTDFAVAVLAGVAEASVTVRETRRAPGATVAWSGLLAYELDELQYHEGYGPCLTASLADGPVLIADVSTDTRWPDFTTQAQAKGAGSIMSLPLLLPLTTEEGQQGKPQVRAALNLYSLQPGSFTAAIQATCVRFAEGAASAVANMRALTSSRATTEGLREAMESRMLIEQAKGILMAQVQCTADEAFMLLAQRSQATHRKLRDIAADIVHTTEPPTPRP